MAAVSLHPLASRSGAQSATVVSVTLPDCDAVDSQVTPKLCGEKDDAEHSPFGYYQGAPSHTRNRSSSNPFLEDERQSNDDHHATEESDDEPIHWNDEVDDREWGLRHDDLDQYPAILDDDEQSDDPAPPIRAMTAAQFAELQRQYASLDVPHSVMFPFLHGVDGDNVAQNAFFGAPLSGMPTPHYRGLTVLRADMPTLQQQCAMRRKRASSSASKLSHCTGGQRSRADSLATSASTFSNDSSGSSEGDEEEGPAAAARTAARSSPVTPSYSNSSISSTTNSDNSRTSSLFSRAMSSDTAATSSTCLDSDAMKASEAAAMHAKASRLRNRHLQSRRSPVYEAQPSHSLLNSTILPQEILTAPLLANLATNSLEVAQQSSVPSAELCLINGATFAKPKQADGISLRNFKMQCIKYATVSDIVIYCPAGLHDGSLTLAQWARQAQEACWHDRISRGLGGLRYNVFVVVDDFDVFERQQPHLIAVDASGFSRNRVDFIEREREEMQRFTEATEIDDNVWMGCTANVPYALEDEYETQGSCVSLDSYLPQEVNPNAFSICIEGRDDAEMPSPSRLNHAAHYMDAFEATAMFEHTSKEALRELEEEVQSSDDDDDRPSLGPNGWSPPSHSKRSSYRRSVPTYRQHTFYPAASNIIHFTAYGSGSSFADVESEEEAMDNIVNMCAWIKKQSCPSSKPASLTNSGILHGAFRYGRSATWPRNQQQIPRRVLLHCSDGYTDTSILGLAYLMYSRQLSLPEAYLDMQNRCNRCFFVYEKDVPFLRRLSQRLVAESKALYGSHDRGKASRSSSHDEGSVSSPRLGARRSNSISRHFSNDDSSSPSVEQSVWARGLAAATGLMSPNPGSKRSNGSLKGSSSSPVGVSSVDMTRTSTPTPGRKSTPTPASPTLDVHSKPTLPQDHRWFTNSHFQGSFPSKILPFLYLGNLSHAMNPAMLHAIGITHVVSVGESALVPKDVEQGLFGAAATVQCGTPVKQQRRKKGSFSHHSSSPAAERTFSDSLWEEERSGRISVLDLKNVSDDGIDSLRPHMKQAMEYIERARLEGGKVLVHCRVGVSRSATICIAYVMAHCDLSMIESFLLVRSRRMNVLTQPTLLFVWELRGLEAQLAVMKEERRRQREAARENGDDHVMQDGVSLAALSISSAGSRDSLLKHGRNSLNSSTTSRSSASYYEDDLKLDIGVGAGCVYGFKVKDYQDRPYNSGSLTRLTYHSAKLTHGYFCKLLSELNARYNVA